MSQSADKKEQKTAEYPFNFAAVKNDTPAQTAARRECQQPQTPRQLTQEDWQYGIGLN
ncbi:MAG: hypothetical protein JWO78_236 [Micavibrio sp.]|nr:hypothetical protein [Micavibrio sp.]